MLEKEKHQKHRISTQVETAIDFFFLYLGADL